MLTTAQIHEFTFLCNCPVGTFFRDVERTFGKKSSFIDHMTQSRIEVLKGIRSLVDERVNFPGKRAVGQGWKKGGTHVLIILGAV